MKNLAVFRKPPVKKAPKLSLDDIKRMVEKVIMPHVLRPERAEAKDLRAIFKVTVVNYCRDIRQ